MTTVILLAAGRSRRFGPACKLQAPFRGKPLVRHAADAILATGFPAVAVVSDPEVGRILPEFRIVAGDDSQSGSLQAGIGQVRDWPALIVLGDMPFVTADLLTCISESPPPAAARHGNLICPPASIPASLYGAIMKLTGDRGAGAFLRGLKTLHTVATLPETLKDIDVPNDINEI